MTAIYTDARCLDHYAQGHPESPDRIRVVVSALRDAGSAYRWPEVLPAEPACVAAVHDEAHVRRIAQLAGSGGGWMDPDTFVGPSSYTAALCAAGAAVQAAADVLAGREHNAAVLVRPPGHHATRDRSMGFCLFNNVAIAAQWAVAEGGARRVAILDVDVHHGNGTQDIFFDRPDVFYFSTHQYPFYPGTGRLDEVGSAEGVGTTVNVPLMAGCGDNAYLAVANRILTPALRRFAPDVVLVSLGFDAHWADPLAQMQLSLDGYAGILGRIRALADQLCQGRLIFVLEGGYHLQVLEEGARMAASLLAGMALGPDPLGPAPQYPDSKGSEELIRAACTIHHLPTG